MGLKVLLHRRARAELESIRDYLVENAGNAVAEEVRLHLRQRIEMMGDFRLRIMFSDGTRGILDCRPIIAEGDPMVEPLSDPTYFARVFLEFGAPTWPNGFDMDPEWLRREMQASGELSMAAAAE